MKQEKVGADPANLSFTEVGEVVLEYGCSKSVASYFELDDGTLMIDTFVSVESCSDIEASDAVESALLETDRFDESGEVGSLDVGSEEYFALIRVSADATVVDNGDSSAPGADPDAVGADTDVGAGDVSVGADVDAFGETP